MHSVWLRTASVFVLSCGVLAVGPSSVTAKRRGPSAARAKKLTKAHFDKADYLYRKGKYKQAFLHYRSAYRYAKLPHILFNMAQCMRKLRNYGMALHLYKLFIQKVPRRNRRQVIRWARRMKGTFTLAMKPAPRPRARPRPLVVARVRPRPRWRPRPRPLIVARVRPRPRPRTRPVVVATVTPRPRVRPGERARPRPTVVASGTITPAVPQKKGPTPFYKKWWFGTGIAVSVGLFAASGGLFAVAQKASKDYRADPNDLGKNPARSLAIATDALWISGAIVAGATVVGAILSAKKQGAVEEKASRRPTIQPACGPTGCGVIVGGRF